MDFKGHADNKRMDRAVIIGKEDIPAFSREASQTHDCFPGM
jgi:hypothetical protein